MDSVIEVTGCTSNVTETFDTQKEDEEAGEQKTQKSSDGKNVDCVIFLSTYIRDGAVGKLYYLRISGNLFCRKKETKGMLYD